MITLTDTAVSKVKQLMDAEGADEHALRVVVHPGGCKGFAYEMYFDSLIGDTDQRAEFAEAVTVVADESSAQLLVGATLDYVEGNEGSGFAITNPNATSGCGCGHNGSH